MAELALNITARNQAQAVINSLGGGLKEIAAQAKTVQQQMQAMGASLTSAGTKMTLGVTTPILGFAGAALKAAADQEQLQVSFTTMLGSAESAKNMMAELSQFAASTPFESPEIQDASKMLLAFGVNAEDIIPTMTNLGDIAAGLNIPIGEMSYLFGTTRAAGRMMTADLNQFTSRGIPMISALAETMGVAESDVKAMVEAGKVGFPEMEAALQSLTSEGGQFSGLMAAQSGTLAGLFSTLKDNVGLSLAEIGRVMIETFDLKTKLAGALVWLEQAKKALFAFAKSSPGLFRMGIIIAGVAAAIGPLLVGAGMLIGWASAAIPVFTALGGVLAALTSPFWLVAGAIAAAGAALLYFDVGGIRTSIMNVVGAAQELFAVFQRGDLFKVWEDGSSYIGDFLQTLGVSEDRVTELGFAFYDLKGAFADGEMFKVWEDGSSYIGEVVQALGVSEEAVTSVGMAVYSLKDAWSVFMAGSDVSTFTASLQTSFTGVKTALSGLFSGEISSGEFITKITTALSGIPTAIREFFNGPDFTALRSNVSAALGLDEIKYDGLLAGLEPLQTAWNTTWTAVSAATGTAWGLIQPKLDLLNTWLVVNVPLGLLAAQNAWNAMWSAAPGVLSAAWTTTETTLTTLDTWLRTNIPLALESIQTTWDATWVALADAVTVAQTTMDVAWAAIQIGWDALVAIFGPAITRLTESFGTFGTDVSGLGGSFDSLLAGVQAFWEAVRPVLTALGVVIGVTVGVVAVTAINLLSSVFNNLGAVIKIAIDQATLILNTFSTVLTAIVTGIKAVIDGDWATAWTSAKTILETLETFISGTLSNALSLISTTLSTVGTTISTTLADLGFEGAAEQVQAVTDKVTTFVDWLGRIAGGKVTLNFTMPAWIKSLTEWVWPALNPVTWVTNLLEWAWPVLASIPWVQTLLEWIWPLMPDAKAWISTLFNWDWPEFFSVPAWVDTLMNWEWPTIHLPAGLADLLGIGTAPAPTAGTTPPTSESWWDQLTGGANGMNNWRGGPLWVGERGPEIVSLPRGSNVHNNKESLDLMSGGRNVTVTIGDIYLGLGMGANGSLDTRSLARELAYEMATEIRRKGF